MNEKGKKRWYAIYTRSRQEQKVYDLLIEQGIDSFLPKIDVYKQYSDRQKKVSEVLFKSYVFVNITLKQEWNVFQTYGVVGFVKFEGKPVPIPDIQIKAVKQFISSGYTTVATEKDFLLGQEVEVIKGAFKGQIGRLIEINTKEMVVIELEAINNYIPIHIHRAFLKKID
jgi:transcription antitermination factor NusG